MLHYNNKLKAKETGDKSLYILSKLFMNSLYGKFGANPAMYRKRMVVPREDISLTDPQYIVEGFMGPYAVVQDNRSKSRSQYYNVATAASITGAERAYLLRALVKHSVRPVYLDTDSMLAEDFIDLPYGKELGEWSDEGVWSEIALAGKKLYGLKCLDVDGKPIYKVASKGARLTYDELAIIASGGKITWASEAPTFSLFRGIGFTERNITMT